MANHFIIIDANKCTDCRTCEVAYVVFHRDNQDCASLTPGTFLSRTHVIKGVNVSTTTLCHQCKDVPCVNVCPNDAISRDKDSIHTMQERCIDCKACVVVCPYGAMGVVVRPAVHNNGVGLNVRAGKAEASECDLCHHREVDPACMGVYSTHALIYVDRNKLEQLNVEKRHHAVLDSAVSLLS